MGRWHGVYRFIACVAGALLCVGSSAPVSDPAHPALPGWIREIDPHDSVDTLAQIRVLFNEPVIPLEAIESPDRQTKLKYFHVSPALPGRFIFLTPRMVGFQMDRALPLATRITVTIGRGLADLRGDALTSDLTWSFETTPIDISNLPSASGVRLDPAFTLVSNTELDLSSLRDRASLTRAFAENVPIDVEFQRDSPYWTEWPGTLFDPSLRNWYYTIKVRQALAKATDYELRVAPGVRAVHGNMPSDKSFAGSFRTYDPLAFGGLNVDDPSPPPPGPLGSRFGNLSLSLRFTNGLSYASAMSHISVSPLPRATASPFVISEGASNVDVDANVLDPRTTYTFTIDGALTDVFGQQLGQRAKATYTTGDLYPDLWAVDGYHIFAPSLGLRLNLIARNLPGNAYQTAFRALHPHDLAFNDERDLLPDRAHWHDAALHGHLNQTSDITLEIRKLLGSEYGVLAYGLAARIPGYEDAYGYCCGDHPMPVYGVAQITDLGLYAQETPDAGLVRVMRLSDGSAVAGASIEVFRIGAAAEGKNGPVPCASATTDALGSASVTAAGWQRCLAGAATPWGPPTLAFVAQSGGDWASIRTDARRQLGGGWETGASSRGTLFTDRQLYQPGETVTITGVAYFEEAGNVHRDANARYELSLQSPDGKSTQLGSAATDEYGTFSVRVPLGASATVGSYQLYADGRNGVRIYGEFTVAQFTPPNFEVHLSIDKALAFGGDTVHLQSGSKYLFGVPLSNAKTAFHSTRSQTRFSPPGWDGFTFGRDLWWFDQPPQLPKYALDVSKSVDARGSAHTTIAVPSDLPYPVLYQVDATTTDVSNRSVADSTTFTALPSDAFIGVATPWLGDAGKPMLVRAIVADHLGKALPGRGVTVLLQRVEYGSSLEQWHPHYVTVDSQTATSAASPVTVSVTAPTAGTYRVHSNFAGSSNDVTTTDAFVWVAGPGVVNWGNDADGGLKIRLDKKSYHAGDTATAVIEAPFVPADLYVSVVKHQLLYHSIVHVAGSAPEVRFTVTPDMLPNAEIEAVLVRQGVILSRANAKSQSALIRFGSAALLQNVDDRYLHVAAAPLHPNVEPGGLQTLSFAVTGSDSRPARAQLAVMVVNDDIVQLTGYRPPNLVEIVYAGQPISSVVVDNREAMLFEQPTEPTGRPLREMRVLGRVVADEYFAQSKSYGPVAAATAAPPPGGGRPTVRVRTNFLKLAYYNLAVRTDAHGMASVTFKTPDDLTRWRVFVEASGAVIGDDERGYRFGYGESTFVATKPLLTNPLLPQFARPGDVFDGGVSVTSGTGATGVLSIEGRLSGPISFARGGSHATLRATLEQGTKAFRFPIEVSRAGSGDVQFTTLMGGASDAFRVPVVLTQLETPEQVIDSGATTSRVTIPLRVDPRVDRRAGGLQLAIASTLLPQITVPAEQMLAEPCYTFLTEAAAQLTAAADMQILSDRYQQRFDALDLHAIAARNLDVYAKLQRPDGFENWPHSTYRDPYANAYAAEALARARQAGFAVDPGLIESATSAMRAIEEHPEAFFDFTCEPCVESARLHAMIALAALGERRTGHLAAVYAQRDKFGYVDRLVLARYLSASPAWKTQAAALAQKLAETIYETGRYATVNMPDSWWWMWSQTENQAQAIRLYSSRPAAADFRDRLVRGLLAQRRKGSWNNTFDTAEALDALVDYLAVEKAPPNFDGAASIDGRTVVAAHFAGYQNPIREAEIGIASLPRGLSNVDLSKAGAGTLHYVVAYRYRLQGAQPGAFEGIRIIRRVHPMGDTKTIDAFDVTAPRAPVRLPAAHVYDVELEIIADHPLDQVVITDPLPAGMEAVDSSFKTATPYFQPLAGSWAIDYSEIYRDRVIAFADRLGAGVYTFHYLVRTVTPGTFLWPGADAHLEFAPEQFGRSASATLQISQ